LRILIPLLGFAPSGGNRVLSEMASAWVRAGHEVTMLIHKEAGTPYFPTDARIVWTDVRGNLSEAVPPEGPPRPGRRGLRYLRSVYAGLGRIGRDYDVILANYSLIAFPVWAARTGRARLFYYIQAYEPEVFQMEGHPVKRLLAALSYRLPLRQIVNGPLYLDYKGIAAQGVVPFGIDLEIYRFKGPPAPLAGADEIVLGCIGSSGPTKGTAYVLAAFEKLWAKDKRYRLRVAYGNLPEGWSHSACEIVMPADDRELAAFYRSVDILIAAGTVQHGAPHYPVLEAMASGTAVVTTGYMPANDGNSWLARNRDSDSLAEKVEEIVAGADHEARVMRAREDVVDFAWDKVAAKMVALFERP
jgi:glycosyltransferase involved in cell wall biosynthesis